MKHLPLASSYDTSKLTQVLHVVGIVGVCLLGVNLFLVYFPRQKGMEG